MLNRDVQVYILANNPTSKQLKYSFFTKSFVQFIAPENNPQNWIQKVIEVVEKESIDVVLPISLSSEKMDVLLKSKLQLMTKIAPLISIDGMDLARNKAEFSKWLKLNGFEQPQTFLPSENFQDNTDFSDMRFPVLIKPIYGFAGQGIKKIDNKETLVQYFEYSDSKPGHYIFQSFVNGFDIDCNFLAENGKVIAYSVHKPLNNESLGYQPAYNVQFFHDAAVVAIGESIIKRLNWTGVASFDFRYDTDSQSLKVIELNPRYWRSAFSSATAGVNFPYISCLYALEKTIPANKYNEIYFVRSSYSIKLKLKNIFSFARTNLSNYRTYLKLNLRDPLPKVYHFIHRLKKS